MTREKTFTMRLSDEESARFDRLAAHFGIPVASMIRMLVKEKEGSLGRAVEPFPANSWVAEAMRIGAERLARETSAPALQANRAQFAAEEAERASTVEAGRQRAHELKGMSGQAPKKRK